MLPEIWVRTIVLTAFCKSVDTVLFETRDCYDDRLMANGTLLDPENTLSNPATGPLIQLKSLAPEMF